MVDRKVKSVTDGVTVARARITMIIYARTDEKPPAIYSVMSLLFLVLPWLRDSSHKHLINSV